MEFKNQGSLTSIFTWAIGEKGRRFFLLDIVDLFFIKKTQNMISDPGSLKKIFFLKNPQNHIFGDSRENILFKKKIKFWWSLKNYFLKSHNLMFFEKKIIINSI